MRSGARADGAADQARAHERTKPQSATHASLLVPAALGRDACGESRQRQDRRQLGDGRGSSAPGDGGDGHAPGVRAPERWPAQRRRLRTVAETARRGACGQPGPSAPDQPPLVDDGGGGDLVERGAAMPSDAQRSLVEEVARPDVLEGGEHDGLGAGAVALEPSRRRDHALRCRCSCDPQRSHGRMGNAISLGERADVLLAQ